MAEAATPLITGSDVFLEWERQQEERYEFVAGVVRLMSGGSANHDLVSMNIARLLGNAAEGGPCRVHGSNLKVRSPAGDVMYPDCFVRCGAHDGGSHVVDDPVIVVEVLSPSTEQHDLTRKRWAYQSIPSVSTILLLDPDRMRLEQCTRQADGSWRSVSLEAAEQMLELEDPRAQISLSAIYQGADTGPKEPKPE